MDYTQKKGENKVGQNCLYWSPICHTQSKKGFGQIWQHGNLAVLLVGRNHMATCYFQNINECTI